MPTTPQHEIWIRQTVPDEVFYNTTLASLSSLAGQFVNSCLSGRRQDKELTAHG